MKTYTCPVCDVLCPNRKNCIDNCRKNINSCVSILHKLKISMQETVSEQERCAMQYSFDFVMNEYQYNESKLNQLILDESTE